MTATTKGGTKPLASAEHVAGGQRSGELAPLLPSSLPVPASSKPQRSVIVSVCSFILATEFCVCLAGATLTGSLPIFFRKRMGLDNVLSTELNNVLLSLSNLTPIVGAYLADKHFGRFHTIGISSIVYLLGLALCTLAATPRFASLPLFMVGLYGGVAFGGGGIKPNVVVLGADQFNTDIPAQRREKASFFNWFYWSINIGSFLSYSVLSNVAVNGAPPFVPEELGFAFAFGCATLAFFIGVAVFYSGQSRYRRLPPKGSALGNFFAVLLEAGRRTAKGKLVLTACAAFIPGIVLTTLSYFVTASPWHMTLALGGASSVVFATVVLIVTGTSTSWLMLSARRHGGSHTVSHVEDVRQVMRLMPYLSIMIIFWAAFGQMKSNFLLQGCQMDLRISTGASSGRPTMVSSAMLSVLNSGSILVFIPVFDRVLYPAVTRLGIYPSLLRKMGSGLVVAASAMLFAGLLEKERKRRSAVEGVFSNCASGNEALPMADLSVWWQTPQYLLIGISEILTSITSYDLFYSEVPESMRSACQALNLLSSTFGYIVAGALNSIFAAWVTTDLNDGHLENIFFALSLLVLSSLGAFLYVTQFFEYSVPTPLENDSRDSFISGQR
ncbi:hypothetical protein ATCC90586_010227 [Pythium insidiosum]|nr:hypothetical protein ATCC90586_010227 [Pythium insidiosum]